MLIFLWAPNSKIHKAWSHFIAVAIMALTAEKLSPYNWSILSYDSSDLSVAFTLILKDFNCNSTLASHSSLAKSVVLSLLQKQTDSAMQESSFFLTYSYY